MASYKIIEQGRPLKEASKALILLHGRGSSAQNILQLAPNFCDNQFYIAAPQAPNHTWYPYSFLEEEDKNEPWLSASVEAIKQLIDHIAQSLSSSSIYLMGFSQGACLTLEVAARYAAPYGGIAAFSGGLIGQTLNEKKYKGNFAGTKVFIGNSDQDPHIPLSRSEQSKVVLENLGAQVLLKVYPGMGHIINEDEIRSVRSLIFSL